MQVNYDNSAKVKYDFRTAPLTISYRCTGSRRQILVNIFVDRFLEPAKLHHVSGVTYNGVALTNPQTIDFPDGGTNRYCMLWELWKPALGLNDMVITFDALSKGFVTIVSYNGTDGIRSSAKIAKTVTASPWDPIVLSVPSQAGDLVVDFLNMQHGFQPTVGAGQTERYMTVPPFEAGINYMAGSDKLATGASTDMSWINGFGAYEAAMMGVSLIPSPITGGGSMKFPITCHRRFR